MTHPTPPLPTNRRNMLALTTVSIASLVSACATTAATQNLAQQNSTALDRHKPYKNYGDVIATAPFGGAVSQSIANYNRASPYIANAGLLHKNGLQEAKDLGFKSVLDLRGSDEDGVSEEAALAERIQITRIHLPVTDRAPTDAQVRTFAKLVEDTSLYPMLVHCVSSNRSGALWALYRASVGVDAETAVEEGRANGLGSREAAVRIRLGIA
ncbi:MAG: sulfur transferase domain-containing protein [Granulosicoccaceae bacterium]